VSNENWHAIYDVTMNKTIMKIATNNICNIVPWLHN
jgi:hypothetical protein